MLLKVGAKGDDVKKVQQALSDNYEDVTVDGNFGPETAEIVEQFQEENCLNADGVVGPQTWAALFHEPPPPVIAKPDTGLPQVTSTAPVQGVDWPLMQSDVEDIMGDPHDPNFKQDWMVFIDVSKYVGLIPHDGFEVKNGLYGFWGNKLIVQPFYAAMELLKAQKLCVYWQVFSGCWCVRNQKGGSSLSQHSWGLAVDINAEANPFNSSRHQLPDAFINCFAKAGFEPGGYWSSPKDFMHFQLSRTRQNWAERLQDLGLAGEFVVPGVPAEFARG